QRCRQTPLAMHQAWQYWALPLKGNWGYVVGAVGQTKPAWNASRIRPRTRASVRPQEWASNRTSLPAVLPAASRRQANRSGYDDAGWSQAPWRPVPAGA